MAETDFRYDVPVILTHIAENDKRYTLCGLRWQEPRPDAYPDVPRLLCPGCSLVFKTAGTSKELLPDV